MVELYFTFKFWGKVIGVVLAVVLIILLICIDCRNEDK